MARFLSHKWLLHLPFLHMQANKRFKYLHVLTHITIVVFFEMIFCSPLIVLVEARLITHVAYCCGWRITWVHIIWE